MIWVTRKEITTFPQSEEGRKAADEYESRLRSRGCSEWRKEDTVRIVITALYSYPVEEDGEADE